MSHLYIFSVVSYNKLYRLFLQMREYPSFLNIMYILHNVSCIYIYMHNFQYH